MPVAVRGPAAVAMGGALGLAALFAGALAQAQESAATYPSRSITFLVGFVPTFPGHALTTRSGATRVA